MKKLYFLLLFSPLALFSQNAFIKGHVVDSENNPLSFVNILLYEKSGFQAIGGTASDESGLFTIEELDEGEYYIEFMMIGFSTVSKSIKLPDENNLGRITLIENPEELNEAVITVKNPSIKKEAGKLTFNVENTSLSTGNTLNLLSKTPGVLVIGDNISIKNSTPIIYFNNKRVYLSATELASLLKSYDASDIKSIEVITNPSANYDAETGTVLNIITSKAISIGYKGSVKATYEQAIFAKYNFGTSHFYKNDWLNMYANYSFSPRKEFKQDDSYIKFFNPDDSTKSFWESDFNRTTKSYGHQGNVILDFTLNDKNLLSFSSNVFVSPNKQFSNNVDGEIFNAQKRLDSTFTTISSLENDTSNLSFYLEHEIYFGEKESSLTTSVSYIKYDNMQTQDLSTDYNLPSGEFLNNISFFTDANQDTNIFTALSDYNTSLAEGTFKTGLKYSRIKTESGLDFFNIENNLPTYVEALSDLFIYNESIYAGFINYEKKWDNWTINAGVRGEFTKTEGDSRSLGIVNTQDYFDVFPSAFLLHDINENKSLSISYKRSLERPRYQSLNPFTYFITDNNVNQGNPNLVPSIKNKYMVSYSHNSKWFVDFYYIYKKDKLGLLTFQDNESSTIRNIESNLISDVNYSVDITYSSELFSWWYFGAYTSTYYMENEFYAIESEPDTYTNSTFGFFGQIYNGLTLSKDRSFTSDITLLYVSNLIEGAYDYNNQFNLSFSLRKSFWNKRAIITVGIDDVFDTYNVPVTSKYYNQDLSYFAHLESRLFRLGFKYNFGNIGLRENIRPILDDEKDRL